MQTISNLQLHITLAFDSTSSRQDYGDPWGKEHGPLRQYLPWTAVNKRWMHEKKSANVYLSTFQLMYFTAGCKLRFF